MAVSWLRLLPSQWDALLAASVATAGVVGVWEGGRWRLGLFVTPRLAVPEAALGVVTGAALITAATLLISASTAVSHARGNGFPWGELAVLYVPAALHEELLFRGYPYQKLRAWNHRFALFFVAIVFAALHAGNDSATPLALTNVFLGGLLLGLAYDRYERLWFPIGLHLAWNVTAGPLFGDNVSGYVSTHTLLIERGGGPVWLTGGGFGVEGSLWMTAVELVAVAWLWRKPRVVA